MGPDFWCTLHCKEPFKKYRAFIRAQTYATLLGGTHGLFCCSFCTSRFVVLNVLTGLTVVNPSKASFLNIRAPPNCSRVWGGWAFFLLHTYASLHTVHWAEYPLQICMELYVASIMYNATSSNSAKLAEISQIHRLRLEGISSVLNRVMCKIPVMLV